jgi:hypothetical protein
LIAQTILCASDLQDLLGKSIGTCPHSSADAARLARCRGLLFPSLARRIDNLNKSANAIRHVPSHSLDILCGDLRHALAPECKGSVGGAALDCDSDVASRKCLLGQDSPEDGVWSSACGASEFYIGELFVDQGMQCDGAAHEVACQTHCADSLRSELGSQTAHDLSSTGTV